MRKLLALLLALPAGLVPFGTPAAAAGTPSAPSLARATVPDTHATGMRFLVRFFDGADAADRAAVVASVGGIVDADLAALHITRIAVAGDAADAFGDGPAVAAFLARQPGVAFAEFDRSVKLDLTPNDPYYATDPIVGVGEWGVRRAAVDRAWDIVRGAPSLTVAVIDSGVDATHPDLQGGTLLAGRTFLTFPSSGCSAASARDDNGHGTHVTGIIAATADNGIGIAGVASGVRILPIKALDCSGQGALSDIARSITFAVDAGARIINISLGSEGDTLTLRSAMRYATDRNALIFAAAGNCGTAGGACGVVNEVSFPAAYPEAIAVGSTEADDSRSSFSTQAAYVTLAAPGRRIISTTPTYPTKLSEAGARQGYDVFSGTSQASPFAAAVAALVWIREPALTGAQVRERLISTVDDLGPLGRDNAFGAGRVNAFRAVTTGSVMRYGATYLLGAIPRTVAPAGSFTTTVSLTNTSSFTWAASGAGAVRLTYQWLDQTGALVHAGAAVPLPSNVLPGASVVVPVTVVAPNLTATLTLRFDLSQDSTGAFSGQAVTPALIAVTLGRGAAFSAMYAVAGTAAVPVTLGAPATIEVTLTNTGTQPWPATGATPVRLAYHLLDAAGAVALWDGPRTPLPRDVAPGAAVVVAAQVASPAAVGPYTVRFDLVQDGVSWFSALGIATRDVAVLVRSGWASSYAVPTLPPSLLPGGRVLVPVTIRNDGTFIWRAGGANPVRAAAHVMSAIGETVMWDGERALLVADLAPGATTTVSVPVAAPLLPGVYRARFDLVQEGVAWASAQGAPGFDAPFAVMADYRAQLTTTASTVSRSAPLVPVTVRNLSGVTWTPTGAAAVSVAAHWLDASGGVLVWDGPRGTLPRPVGPGESVLIGVPVAPPPPGAALLVIDLVSEGLRWFGAGTPRPVTVIP